MDRRFCSRSGHNASLRPERPTPRCNARSRAGARLRQSRSGLRPPVDAHQKSPRLWRRSLPRFFAAFPGSGHGFGPTRSQTGQSRFQFGTARCDNEQRHRDRPARHESRRGQSRARRPFREAGFPCYRRSSAGDSIEESIFVEACID